MKIAIMGAGGLGAYYGVRLLQTGHDVTFIARGAHLAAMRAHGLQLKSSAGDARIASVRATDDPSAAGTFDHIVFAVKLWDTQSAAEAMKPMIGPATTIVSFQNGVEKDAMLASAVGREPVIGGVSYISVKIAEPGVIEHTGAMTRVILGELDDTRSERIAELVTMYAEAGVDSLAAPSIARATWEKFAYLSALSGLTALMRTTIGPIRSNERSRSLFRDAILEAVAVGSAKGIAFDRGFTDVQMAFTDTLPEEMRASMAVDLERGRRLEVPWLSGAVERIGRDANVAAPVSSVIARALAPFADG